MSATQNGLMRPRALGQKARSFTPSKSRNHDGEPPQKRFKTVAAPRGTKLGKGYTDRARERQAQADDEDDKEEGMKRLQRLLRDGTIDQQRYESLRDEIGVGGDTSNTHLVRGLDFKLLERTRRGEDVIGQESAEQHETGDAEPDVEPDSEVDDQFEQALARNVEAPQVAESDEATADHGYAAQPIQSKTLSRDEILKQLKQNRKQGVPSTATPVQDTGIDRSKFRKVETPKPQKEKFIEIVNGRRREVLIITDKEGKTKRKTRWLESESTPILEKPKQPVMEVWGGDLPEETLALQKAAADKEAQESSDDDIFGGVPEYNPLEGIEDDEDEDGDGVAQKELKGIPPKEKTMPLPGEGIRRSYFGTTKEEPAESSAKNDPTILAALKRAAQLRRSAEEHGDAADEMSKSENTDRNAALLKKLQQQSRQDDVDLDMGFDGSARVDEDEEGIQRQKLSVWKGIGEENDDEDGDAIAEKGGKRKRGGKKKKGDKNSFADVMSVIAGRRK